MAEVDRTAVVGCIGIAVGDALGLAWEGLRSGNLLILTI